MSKILKGLPEVDSAALTSGKSVFEIARVCPHCKKGEGVRIISNHNGVHARCGPCKKFWPISSAPLAAEIPMSAARGLRKETIVEPDWEKAYDIDTEDVNHDAVGPKKR